MDDYCCEKMCDAIELPTVATDGSCMINERGGKLRLHDSAGLPPIKFCPWCGKPVDDGNN